MLRRLIRWMVSIGIAMSAGVLDAQPFPNKPVRIVTTEAGGGSDFGARLIAQGVNWGQQVIVDNRAGGIIATELVVKAPPNGYTLLFYGSTVWLLSFMRDKVTWDAMRDFSPITWATSAPNILVVHPALAVNSVKELIAQAKARPGTLNDAGGGNGTSSHLAAELFKSMVGVDIVRVPYKGNGPAINAVVSAEVQLLFATPGSVAAHIKSGRLKALAVTSAQPSLLVPGLPTVAASGVPGYEAVSIVGILAPAKTPALIVARLNEEFVRALNRPEVKEKFFASGIETVGNTPEEFAAVMKSEMNRLGKVIRDAGIRAD